MMATRKNDAAVTNKPAPIFRSGVNRKNLPGISSQADRWNVNEFLSTHPKDSRGDGHEDTGQSEGNVRTVQARAFKKTDNRQREFCDETARLGFVRFQ